MGKNPNAKKLKDKKHKERAYETNIHELEEEAARRGISVIELQEEQEEKRKGSDDEDEEDSSEEV
jgi:hypothetical protein